MHTLVEGNEDHYPYYGVFNKDIYNQEKVFRERINKSFRPQSCDDILTAEENMLLTQELIDRKKASVENYYAKKILSQVESLKTDLEKQGVWKDIATQFSSSGGVFRGTAAAAMLFGKRMLSATGGIIFNLIGGSAQPTARQTQLNTAHNKELEILLKYHILLEGIEEEEVYNYEREYIKKKRYFNNALQDSIEEALILARGPTKPFGNIIGFIKEAISLPFTLKRLISLDSQDDIQKQIYKKLQEFDKKAEFSILEHSVKEELKNLLFQFYISSLSSSDGFKDSNYSTRVLCYFYGNAGAGKSETAINLCKFIGINYDVIALRGPKDLEQVCLEGASWDSFQSNIGSIIRPFIKKDETHLNAVLIINDFDRVLMEQSVPSAIALGFLLDFLDPQKKEFWSPYFKAPINIRHLSVIITGNAEIPKEGELANAYKPLKSRLREVKFPEFSEHSIRIVLKEHLKNLEIIYKVTFSEEVKKDLLSSALHNMSEKDLRRSKSKLEYLVRQKIISSYPDMYPNS